MAHLSRAKLPSCLLAACLLAACGAVARPTSSPTPSPPAVIVLHDVDNGHVLRVHVGQRVQLVLASTYWNVAGSSDPSVLRQTGQPAVSPQPTGCVPGEGCGTVSAGYDAIAAGRAQLTASRLSCGEALRCVGPQAAYRVTVLVSS